MNQSITYQVNRTIAISELGSIHSWENISKSKVPVYCDDCGEKYIYKFGGTNTWFDKKNGKTKILVSKKLVCRNKRWYHLLKH